jgi:extracellular factor (EF) 3-hydroxypalmitic acid methyl ester biosynthesis protein
MLLDSPPRTRKFKAGNLDCLIESVGDLIESGGPKPEDYAGLNRAIRKVADDVRAGVVSTEVVKAFVGEVTEKHFTGSLQAAARAKPHGYSGDFEIIDSIYSLRLSGDPKLRLWDMFFQAQAAPCAVRNRKAFFHQLLNGLPATTDGSRLRVLNVGCGPARDLREWFLSGPAAQIFFDCVEMDAKAIQYASGLCRPFLQHIEFYHENALRYVPSRGYDLVWSAGLFDYLNDRVFVRLLKALLAVVKPGGELVVGNFSEFNPSRDYMEIFGDWHLVHRSREQLLSLAERAGAGPGAAKVLWEPEGVNLFLQITAH